MTKPTNPKSAKLGLAILMIVGAAWIGPGVSSAEAQNGPPGPVDVNVVDSVELGVAVTDSALTHMGQHLQDHVTLVDRFEEDAHCGGTGSFRNRILVRMSPDGTTSTDEFEVPAGRNLVITDVTWRTSGLTTLGDPLSVGESLALQLSVGNASVISTADTIDTAGGRPGASVHLVSGVAVGPGAGLCPSAAELSPTGFFAVGLGSVVINGYLIDASP
ncbi:MAG: hypothetical protein PVF51_11370 [Nitrospirota bacterium]